ncbi:MAG: PQQ-binding-like beta-propeller repeat protein [Phycisphaerae bacterium]|jgi:outer membrane protein assembly factor BamB|nr:PQQ-binding-like beta-propeller repeat protein [Phycisphaerae bacterium]
MDYYPGRLTRLIVLAALTLIPASGAMSDDWPTYRRDNQRTAISGETLTAPLSVEWVFSPRHAPSHAWGDPQPIVVEGNLELPRMRFDDAFHVAAVGDSIYFASSADNKVYCLHAPSGQIRWEFFTNGPVRLAPTVSKGKVYVGSDDGKVYCLDARSGSVVWTFQAAPSNRLVLGNGKMISLWPVRTGVVVDGDIAYFGAGVFPAEGTSLYAVNATNGKLIWTNDGFGKGGLGSISPQGYMVASKDRLFVASGRGMPATFERKDGKFVRHSKFIWRRVGLFGGTYSVLAGDMLFNGTERMLGIKADTGKLEMSEEALRLVIDKDIAYILSGAQVVALDRKDWTKKRGSQKLYSAGQRIKGLERRIARDKWLRKPGIPTKSQQSAMKKYIKRRADEQKVWDASVKWRAKCTHSGAMALTKKLLFTGGKNSVAAFDIASGKSVWSTRVDGKTKGLAVANGRLLASTDTGKIYCFVPGKGGKDLKIAQKADFSIFPTGGSSHPSEALAEELIKDSGARRGYGLVLGGSGSERLAFELAKRSALMIYVVNPDAKAAAEARKKLSVAGMHGARVTVLTGRLDALPFSDYFANIIVSSEATTPASEVLRMLKPCGGVAYLTRLDKTKLTAWSRAMQKELSGLGENATTIAKTSSGVKVTRGALNGAGSWKHEYAEPGNTGCGDDQLVKGQMDLLWYGEPGPGRMPSRHASAAAPLAFDGRMFVQGKYVIMAYDAYNGILLWKRDIAGAIRLGLKTKVSNLAGGMGSLFVATKDKCLRLDAETGRTLRTYELERTDNKEPDTWDYIACVGKTLYGSRNSNRIFAIDIETGKFKWRHDASSIMTVTISIGDGRLFYVDRNVTDAQKEEGLKGISDKARLDSRGKPVPPDVRLVVCLNAATGKVQWTKPLYVADCIPKVTKAHGDVTMMYSNNVLLLAGQPWNGHFWREFFSGGFSRRSLIALAGDSGKMLWSGHKGYRSRPLIVGDRVIAEPWAHDLRTGVEKTRNHPITETTAKWQFARPGHHCGNIAASPNVLFFRSGTAGYYDLESDSGTVHFGGQRPGCWINCIPANGLVMMPEASSGCVCPVAIQCTTVFVPRKAGRKWGMFSAPGPMTPVKRLGVNFGAPGDRKDSDGKIWLGYPRPFRGRLVMDLKIDAKLLEDGRYFSRNADFLKIDDTRAPWIYASGVRGITKCKIPLLAKNDKAQKYTVRLHFAEPDGAAPGKRIFDVLLEGKPCLKKFDIAAGAKGGRIIKEFRGVNVTGSLTIELKPADLTEEGTSKFPPVISGIEMIVE